MDDQCVSHGSPQRGGGQTSTEVQRPSVVRCGWLRKQGGFVKTWHSRWFVLRGDQLYYYKDEEETKALEKPECSSTIEIFILLIYPLFFVWLISQPTRLSQKPQATSAAQVSEG